MNFPVCLRERRRSEVSRRGPAVNYITWGSAIRNTGRNRPLSTRVDAALATDFKSSEIGRSTAGLKHNRIRCSAPPFNKPRTSHADPRSREGNASRQLLHLPGSGAGSVAGTQRPAPRRQPRSPPPCSARPPAPRGPHPPFPAGRCGWRLPAPSGWRRPRRRRRRRRWGRRRAGGTRGPRRWGCRWRPRRRGAAGGCRPGDGRGGCWRAARPRRSPPGCDTRGSAARGGS